MAEPSQLADNRRIPVRKQLGQRVRILTGIGLPETVGRTGTIIAHEHDQDRRVTLYRVALDSAVYVPGAGHVAGDRLKNIPVN
jgi:hypothetical protein